MRLIFSALITSLSWLLICCAPYGQNVNRNTASNHNYPVPSDPIILAPGTVRVSAVVIDCTEKEKVHLCTFQIEETHGYGAATPPLPLGSEVSVEVSKFLLEKGEYLASDLLKKGNIVKATLRFQEPRSTTKDAVSWRAIKLHKKNDKRRDRK